MIIKEKKLWISIDWKKVPVGMHRIPITITGKEGSRVVVQAVVRHQPLPSGTKPEGFVESQGYTAMESEHFTKAAGGDGVRWSIVPNLGRTSSGVITLPVTAAPQLPAGNESPHLEYIFHTTESGAVQAHVYLSPTLDFHHTGGLRYAISIDDEAPQIINLHENFTTKVWEQAVSDNILIKKSRHTLLKPGQHVLKFWRVDPGVVLQRIVVGATIPSGTYLGPPESFRLKP